MSKTVMIAEDNELNMKLFHDLLEAHGYRTIGTRNGFEVLDPTQPGPFCWADITGRVTPRPAWCSYGPGLTQRAAP
jgi:hypothetical protein